MKSQQYKPGMQTFLNAVLHGQNEALRLAFQNAPLLSVLEVLVLTAEKASQSKVVGSILLVDKSGLFLRCSCAPHLPPAYCTAIDYIPIKDNTGSCGTAAFRAKPVIVKNIQKDPLWKGYSDYALAHNLHSCWSTPIMSSRGTVLGTFALYYDTPTEPTQQDREVVELLTTTATLVIEKQQQLDKNLSIEKALRQSNYRYELACRATKDVIWEWDLLQQQIRWNEAIVSQLKYPRESMITDSKWWYERIHPDDAQRVKDGIHGKMRRGEEEWEDEYRLKLGDEKYGLFYDRGFIIYDDTGKPVRMIGAMANVTEARESAIRLKDSETHFRALSEAAPQMLFIADPQGNITYYNQRFFDYVGKTFDEIKDWNWTENPLHHPDDLEETLAKWQASLESGSPFEMQYRIRRKDGEYRWHLGRALAIRNEKNDIVNWYGTNTDIHDQKLMADNLKQNEQRLTQAVNAAQLGFWEYDLKDNRFHWSEIMRQITGFKSDNLSGDYEDTLASRLHPSDLERSKKVVEDTIRTKEPYKIEVRLVPSPGEIRWIEFTGECVFDESGNVKGIIGTGMNITNRKLADQEILLSKEAAERASKAKTLFLANMSHEIRTPLGAITGFAGLLRDPTLSKERFEEYLSVINRNSEQLLHIVDDILDISKVEAGKLEIENFDFSISEVLSDFASLMEFKASAKNIKFRSRVEGSLPTRIHSDAARIRQILSNVVGNAIKFTDIGKVDLITRFENDELIFKVIDTGVGISREQATSLFQPFHQADPSTTRRFGGTGLGLVLTRRLCEAMEGNFNLEHSELGVGSTFVARIKVEVMEAEINHDVTKSLTPVHSRKSLLSGLRLLVVDDSDDTRLLIGSMLESLGAKVFSSANGLEGYRTAMSKNCDLIFMDIQMPIMDGYEATRKLRENGYDRPIVAVTAHAMQEERVHALSQGFTDFMTKPVHERDFLETISRYTH